MSLDTVTRVIDFFETNIETPNSLYTIYRDKNYDLSLDEGGGPFCELFVAPSFDSFVGYGAGVTTDYTEIGTIVIRIFVDSGLGDDDYLSLSRVSDIIRDAFRDQVTGKQLKLFPTGSQEGVILFEDMEPSQTVIEESRRDITYRRKDIFINYQKLYNKS